MHRFFLSPDCIIGNDVSFPDDVVRQLTRVLRLTSGEQVVVLDNSGMEYVVTLNSVTRDSVKGCWAEKRLSDGEPDIQITLYQGLLKADKFEYVLQKGTEVGISRFVPVVCQRSIPRERGAGRMDRWQRIVTEAAEQSGRGKIPALENPIDFSDACNEVDSAAVIPWEQEDGLGIRSWLRSSADEMLSLGVFIGPEGGFSEDEVGYARSKGIAPVSLGKRILRAETAGVVTAAAIMYELGELGG